jgi:hypothetical protein
LPSLTVVRSVLDIHSVSSIKCKRAKRSCSDAPFRKRWSPSLTVIFNVRMMESLFAVGAYSELTGSCLYLSQTSSTGREGNRMEEKSPCVQLYFPNSCSSRHRIVAYLPHERTV